MGELSAKLTERALSALRAPLPSGEASAHCLTTKFKFIGLFNHIRRLKFMQEQSRQILLPGLKLLYENPPF